MRLLDLALRLRWSTIAERASTHPQEITEQDSDGLTVLHWACCNEPPSRTIQILLELNAQHSKKTGELAVLQQDLSGMTPLLNACACHASLPVIWSLTDAAPESVSIVDNDGWTALHYICYGVKHQRSGIAYAYTVASRILDVDESVVWKKDTNGHTPLFLLCQMYEEEVERGCTGPISLVDYTGIIAYAEQSRHFPSAIRDFWALASLIIQKASHDKDKLPLLHDIAALPHCHPSLIKIAIELYSDQLSLQNDQGNTPLHLAASSISESSLRADATLALACPQVAKIRNSRGEFPLVIALKADCGWTSGHARLLDAYPIAFESCFLSEAFYPFLMAKIDSLSTLFEILRAKPSLIYEAHQP